MSIVQVQLNATANFAPVYQELSKLRAALASLSAGQAGTIMPQGLVQGLKSAEDRMLNLAKATGAFNVQTVELASSTERLTKQISQGKLKLGEYFSLISGARKGVVGQLNDIAAAQARIQGAKIVPDATKNGFAHVITATGAVADKSKQAAIYQQLLNTAYKDGAEKLINFGKNTQWAGRQLTAGLTVPMMLAGKAASQMFLEVSSQMTRLQKVYGVGVTQATKAQLDAVKSDIVGLASDLSKTLGLAAKETTSMAADLAAAGLTGKDLINATKQASRMVVLGETDKQDAIKATIALQTAFKLNTSELTDSVNFFNAAQAATSTNMADLIGAVPRVGPVIKGLGGDYKDMVALLTAMKEGGVSAGEGANALKNSLARIIAPTQKAKDTLKGYGIDMDGIVSKNTGNLIGTITDLQTALDKLPSLERQRAISEMFGKYQFSRMTALFNNFNREGTQSAKVMEMMGLSSAQLAGIADKQTKIIQESAAGKYKIAMESLKTAILPIGESFLSFATKALHVGETIVRVFNKLGPIASVLKGLMGTIMTVGPITMVIGLIANLGGQLMKYYNFMRMFRQGFGESKGLGFFGRMGAGFKGTKNFFQEADPALLANERLSKTVTDQVMKEEDAIKLLTSAIAEYAAEVERLQQIYSGGPITPVPPAGGTPGAAGVPPTGGPMPSSGPSAALRARAAAAAASSTPAGSLGEQLFLGNKRYDSYEGTPEFIHAGQGISTMGSLENIGGTGRISRLHAGFFSVNESEKVIQKAFGNTIPQLMLPENELKAMTPEKIRQLVFETLVSEEDRAKGEGKKYKGALDRMSPEDLMSFFGTTRTQSHALGDITQVATIDKLVKKGVSLDEITKLQAESGKDFKEALAAFAKKHGVFMNHIEDGFKIKTDEALKLALEDVKDIVDPKERMAALARALATRTNELIANVLNNATTAVLEEFTYIKQGEDYAELTSENKAAARDKGSKLFRRTQIASESFDASRERKSYPDRKAWRDAQIAERAEAAGMTPEEYRDAQRMRASNVKTPAGRRSFEVERAAKEAGMSVEDYRDMRRKQAEEAKAAAKAQAEVEKTARDAEYNARAEEMLTDTQRQLSERRAKEEERRRREEGMTRGQKIRSRMRSRIEDAAEGVRAKSRMGQGMAAGAVMMGAGFLGDFMRRGSEGKEFGDRTALQQMGSGMQMGMSTAGAIGQFLPPPWNLVATGAGAIVGAVGGLLAGKIAQAKMYARQEAAALAGSVMASTTALEHFKIKVVDFSTAAFKAAVTTNEAVKTEIDALAEKYKAQEEQDAKFKDEVEGIKRMSSAEQFKLLKERFLADVAAGLTTTQAKADVAGYMKNAGITGFGAATFITGLQKQMQGMTQSQAITAGFQGAAGNTGAFAFNVVQTAQTVQSLYSSFNQMDQSLSKTKNNIVMTSDTFNQYNAKVTEQNSALGMYNQAAMETAIRIGNLKDGSVGYQNALQRLMVANRLFVNGTIQTAQDLMNATATEKGLESYVQVDTVNSMLGGMANALDQTGNSATKSSAAKTNAQTKAINKQKAVIKGLQDEYDQNQRLYEQKKQDAELDADVQNLREQASRLRLAGRTSDAAQLEAAARQKIDQLAQTRAYERRQASIQAKIDKAQGTLTRLQSQGTKATNTVSSVAQAAMSATAGVAQESKTALDTLLGGLATWHGSVEGYLASLGGENANTPAGKALKSLKDAGKNSKDIATILNTIKATPEFKELANTAASLALSIKTIRSLSDVADAKSAQSKLASMAQPAMSKAASANRLTLGEVQRGKSESGKSVTSQTVGEDLKSVFDKKGGVKAAAAALGVQYDSSMNYADVARAAGYYGGFDTKTGKEAAIKFKQYVWDAGGEGKPVDKSLLPWLDQGYFSYKYNNDLKKYVVLTMEKNGNVLPVLNEKGKKAARNGLLSALILNSDNLPKMAAGEYYKYQDYHHVEPGGSGYHQAVLQKYNSDGSTNRRSISVDEEHWYNKKNPPTKGNYADGGYISGPGGPKDDLIPAMLSNGEYVMNAAAVRKHGIGFFNELNNPQHFDGGGEVRRLLAAGYKPKSENKPWWKNALEKTGHGIGNIGRAIGRGIDYGYKGQLPKNYTHTDKLGRKHQLHPLIGEVMTPSSMGKEIPDILQFVSKNKFSSDGRITLAARHGDKFSFLGLETYKEGAAQAAHIDNLFASEGADLLTLRLLSMAHRMTNGEISHSEALTQFSNKFVLNALNKGFVQSPYDYLGGRFSSLIGLLRQRVGFLANKTHTDRIEGHMSSELEYQYLLDFLGGKNRVVNSSQYGQDIASRLSPDSISTADKYLHSLFAASKPVFKPGYLENNARELLEMIVNNEFKPGTLENLATLLYRGSKDETKSMQHLYDLLLEKQPLLKDILSDEILHFDGGGEVRRLLASGYKSKSENKPWWKNALEKTGHGIGNIGRAIGRNINYGYKGQLPKNYTHTDKSGKKHPLHPLIGEVMTPSSMAGEGAGFFSRVLPKIYTEGEEFYARMGNAAAAIKLDSHFTADTGGRSFLANSAVIKDMHATEGAGKLLAQVLGHALWQYQGRHSIRNGVPLALEVDASKFNPESARLALFGLKRGLIEPWHQMLRADKIDYIDRLYEIASFPRIGSRQSSDSLALIQKINELSFKVKPESEKDILDAMTYLEKAFNLKNFASRKNYPFGEDILHRGILVSRFDGGGEVRRLLASGYKPKKKKSYWQGLKERLSGNYDGIRPIGGTVAWGPAGAAGEGSAFWNIIKANFGKGKLPKSELDNILETGRINQEFRVMLAKQREATIKEINKLVLKAENNPHMQGLNTELMNLWSKYTDLYHYVYPATKNFPAEAVRLSKLREFQGWFRFDGPDIMNFATGGYISGPGGPREDLIPAMLSNGEYVISAAAAKKIGLRTLDMLNDGMMPRFAGYANGGAVGSISESSSNPVYNISVNVAGSNSSADDIAKVVMNTLRRQQESLSTNRSIG